MDEVVIVWYKGQKYIPMGWENNFDLKYAVIVWIFSMIQFTSNRIWICSVGFHQYTLLTTTAIIFTGFVPCMF